MTDTTDNPEQPPIPVARFKLTLHSQFGDQPARRADVGMATLNLRITDAELTERLMPLVRDLAYMAVSEQDQTKTPQANPVTARLSEQLAARSLKVLGRCVDGDWIEVNTDLGIELGKYLQVQHAWQHKTTGLRDGTLHYFAPPQSRNP